MNKLYIINQPFMLCGFKKLPYALQRRDNGKIWFFREKEFYLLMSCDGQTLIDPEKLAEEEERFLKSWQEMDFIRECGPDEELKEWQKYRYYDVRYKNHVHWAITGKCNYRCRHCFMSAPHAAEGEPPFKELMAMLDSFERCGIRAVSLTGGEPLIRSDFWDLVDAIRDKGIVINTIYSNGLLVTDQFLDRLCQRGLRPGFQFSFDGVGHHDWMRGVPGAEKVVIDAMKRCRERGFEFSSSMSLCRESVGCIRESVNLLASLGCRGLKISNSSPQGEWLSEPQHYLTRKEVWQAYLDYIPAYYEDGKPMPIGLEGFFNCNPPEMIPAAFFEKNLSEERFSKAFLCGQVRTGLYVSPKGKVLPCMSMTGTPIEEQFPNMLETPLEKILNESYYMDMVNKRISDLMEHNPECASCEYKCACCGGCRAIAVRGGSTDYLAPDPDACAYFKEGWKQKKEELIKSLGVEADQQQ